MQLPASDHASRVYLLWRTLAVFFILALWILSLWPAEELSRLGARLFNDKLEHFIGYLLLAWVLRQGWPRQPLWLAWLVAFVCGAGIEFAQAFSPSRHFSWWDMLANGAGALTGVLISVKPWRWLWRAD